MYYQCLINNISIPKTVAYLYLSHIINQWQRDLNTDFRLGNYLFGSIDLTKNTDPDKYKWLRHRILFSFRIVIYIWKHGKNVIIFGADMSLSVYIDNKNKDVFILGEGPTQGLNDTILTAEAKYPINFT